MKITEAIKNKRLYFDGGAGTLLQAMGLEAGKQPGTWNILYPERIIGLHRDYLEAGADIITTNTFGIENIDDDDQEKYIRAGMDCAKEAVKGFENKYIAFDMGPTGRLIKPMGNMEFEEAVEIFAKNAQYAKKYGADLIIIETMNDAYEAKAALLAAKESTDLPVFVTNAFDERQKLMTGADPEACIALLEGLGADAIGMNCSFGPDKMLPIVDKYMEYASVPVIVNPNAGLPKVVDGRTVFDIGPEEFSDIMVKIAKKGAGILGGCCGTTPAHIRALVEKTKDIPYKVPERKNHTLVSSYSHTVEIGKQPVIVGERINPTGKKKVKEALKSENYNFILQEAIKQEEAGSHILDVNAGIPDIDEKRILKELVTELQSVTDIPLQIDTSDADALETAMRVYNGKPMVNSVNGSENSMTRVLPLVKKYGGVAVALTMDEDGIPDTAEGRYKIAERIVERAESYGIDRKNIIVDTLTMTVSSDENSAKVTLDAIKLVKERLEVGTTLGVSNISFGLPRRSIINSAFFTMALYAGLDAAIMDPYSEDMMKAFYSYRALMAKDRGCMDYIAFAEGKEMETKSVSDNEITLKFAIEKGFTEEALRLTGELLLEMEPLDIINEHLIPALNSAGAAFEEKRIFLPQLIMTAEAAGGAFEILKEKMPSNADESRKVIVATVKGDIHDIGKNIAKALLESYGFYVADLGRDVEPDVVAENAEKAALVGLSALMTTTVPAMEETIKKVRAVNPDVKILVGGAVLTEDYAMSIGADYYCADAMDTVRAAREVLG